MKKKSCPIYHMGNQIFKSLNQLSYNKEKQIFLIVISEGKYLEITAIFTKLIICPISLLVAHWRILNLYL